MSENINGYGGSSPLPRPLKQRLLRFSFWHTRRVIAFEDTFGHPLFRIQVQFGGFVLGIGSPDVSTKTRSNLSIQCC